MTDSVFVKKQAKKKQSYEGLPILHLIGSRPKTGDIGIEIEVEGNKFPKGSGYELNEGDRHKIPKTWKFTHDGSLRGEDNAEYVLANPIKFDEVEKAITDLWQMFSDYGSVLADSNRTSVHVHLNVQQFHLNRLCSFVAMYFAMEDLLTSWCGDHRVGNLFCLRAKDAPAIVRRLKEFFQQDGWQYQFSSGMHYAGLNPSAIHKFGSVEIRSLRGVSDPQVILDWVAVLRRLYERSEDFKDPRDVVSGFSGSGPIAWLQNLLGDKYSVIMDNVPYTTDEVRDILYEGIRFAQDLCYCRDWSEYEEKKMEVDPFNRTSGEVISPSPAGLTTISTYSQMYGTISGSTSHEDTYSKNLVNALYNQGTIDSSMYIALKQASFSVRSSWLRSNNYWNYDSEPTVPVPSEPDYDYEDIFDEDDE